MSCPCQFPDDNSVLLTLNIFALDQRPDEALVDGRLGGKVEALDCLDDRKKRLLSSGTAHVVTATIRVFEIPDFTTGTKEPAEALAASSAKTIIGGGDSVTAVKRFGLAGKMTFIPTRGGASRDLLEGKELPGVAALTDP